MRSLIFIQDVLLFYSEKKMVFTEQSGPTSFLTFINQTGRVTVNKEHLALSSKNHDVQQGQPNSVRRHSELSLGMHSSQYDARNFAQ